MFQTATPALQPIDMGFQVKAKTNGSKVIVDVSANLGAKTTANGGKTTPKEGSEGAVKGKISYTGAKLVTDD